MTLQEMLRDERREGREEGRAAVLEMTKGKLIDSLSAIGEISTAVKERVEQITEVDVLMDWYVAASTSKTMKEFEEKVN